MRTVRGAAARGLRGHPLHPLSGPVRVDGADRVRTALIYEYPVDRLVTRAKFQSRAECALALGELLGLRLRAARISRTLIPPDVIVPVPLHRRRLARRGFNQAAEIAAPIARMLGVPLMERGCRRVVETVEQTTLSGSARRANLRGAFHVDTCRGGLRAAIVDDVLTTGTTVAELTQAFLDAGAAAVEVWVAARSFRAPPGAIRPDETCKRARSRQTPTPPRNDCSGTPGSSRPDRDPVSGRTGKT